MTPTEKRRKLISAHKVQPASPMPEKKKWLKIETRNNKTRLAIQKQRKIVSRTKQHMTQNIHRSMESSRKPKKLTRQGRATNKTTKHVQNKIIPRHAQKATERHSQDVWATWQELDGEKVGPSQKAWSYRLQYREHGWVTMTTIERSQVQ